MIYVCGAFVRASLTQKCFVQCIFDDINIDFHLLFAIKHLQRLLSTKIFEHYTFGTFTAHRSHWIIFFRIPMCDAIVIVAQQIAFTHFHEFDLESIKFRNICEELFFFIRMRQLPITSDESFLRMAMNFLLKSVGKSRET